MINILLHGCNGKMGQVISKLLYGNPNIAIAAGIDKNINKHQNYYPVFDSFKNVNVSANAIVDYSHPDALQDLLEYSVDKNMPVVIATTGFSQIHYDMINEAAKKIPVFISANMSLGVNVIMELAVSAAASLYQNFDIEILEKHHNEKKDAPSGTALMIANEINKVLSNSMKFVYDRSSSQDRRKHNEIGIFSIRGGSIPGEHTIVFAGQDEIVEIKHTALSKEIFARGTLVAVEYIVNKPKGLYNMRTLLKE